MPVFYTAVAEDRHDPLMLGRVRVRVLGIHTDDKTILPTADLPWAYVMSPTTSATISGVGQSPTGIVSGTWCIVTFLDGNSCQMPIIMGTLGGIPQGGNTQDMISDSAEQPLFRIGDEDTVVPTDPDSVAKRIPHTSGGGAIISPPETLLGGEVGPLNTTEYLKLRETIAAHESGGDYGITNSRGYLGRYQLGALALETLHYVRKGTTNKDLKHPEFWLGLDGIVSADAFLAAHSVQDQAMLKNTQLNYAALKFKKALAPDSDKNHVAGALMSAHLVGAGGTAKFFKTKKVQSDANGTTSATYYKLGYASLAGELPAALPSSEPPRPLSQASANARGFSDPSAKYPLQSTINESDTNRIARAENIADTFVGIKELDRVENVRVAGSVDCWNQPHIPYAAAYPYNQVRSSEGGIVEEIDNTPGAVRYQLYHPSGTYTEVDNNGTTVNRIVGNGFSILERDGNVVIRGICNVTIEGDANLLVQHNCNLEVYGDMNAVVKNDLNTTVHGKSSMYIQEDFSIKCKTFNVETFGGDVNLLSSANIDSKCAGAYNVDIEKELTIKAGKSTKLVCDDTVSLKATGTFSAESADMIKLQSTGNTSLKVGASFNTDAADIYAQAGLSVAAAHPSIDHMEPDTLRSGVALPATPAAVIIKDAAGNITRQQLVEPNFSTLPAVPSRFDGIGNRIEGDADDYDHEAFVKYTDKIDNGNSMATIDAAPYATDSTHVFDKTILTAVADYPYENFVNEENIPKGVQISPNYTLQQFLVSSDGLRRVIPQHGLSEGEIVQNLHYLAVNIVEKVKVSYPEMIITSGLRSASGSSLHERGQAVDMQFVGRDKSEYYAIAQTLASILPYDKILLEYKNFGSGMPWIHVQFRQGQNRGEVYTFFNHKKHSNGLVKLA